MRCTHKREGEKERIVCEYTSCSSPAEDTTREQSSHTFFSSSCVYLSCLFTFFSSLGPCIRSAWNKETIHTGIYEGFSWNCVTELVMQVRRVRLLQGDEKRVRGEGDETRAGAKRERERERRMQFWYARGEKKKEGWWECMMKKMRQDEEGRRCE